MNPRAELQAWVDGEATARPRRSEIREWASAVLVEDAEGLCEVLQQVRAEAKRTVKKLEERHQATLRENRVLRERLARRELAATTRQVAELQAECNRLRELLLVTDHRPESPQTDAPLVCDRGDGREPTYVEVLLAAADRPDQVHMISSEHAQEALRELSDVFPKDLET